MQRRTSAVDIPVVSTLVDDVRTQEVKEALLAYFFLWVDAGGEWRDIAWIDEHVERFLQEEMGATVDFDCQDAVDKLVCLGLVAESHRGGKDAPAQYLIKYVPAEWLDRFPHQKLTRLKLREHRIQE